MTDLVQQGRELYISAGSFGQKWNSESSSEVVSNVFRWGRNKTTDPETLDQRGINTPQWTWKTILTLDEPGLDVPDITLENAEVHTFITPNVPEPFTPNQTWVAIPHPLNALGFNLDPITSASQWRNPQTWSVELGQLENILNAQRTDNVRFNFLSNIPEPVRNPLKGILSAPLLANTEDSLNIFEFNDYLTSWHSSVAQADTIQQSTFPTSISQISTSQIDTGHVSATQINTSQVGIAKVGTHQASTNQISITQISTTKVNPLQAGFFQIGTAQVGTGEVGFSQTDIAQVSTPKISALQNNAIEPSLASRIAFEKFLSIDNSGRIVFNIPVRHGGIAEESFFSNDKTQVSPSQIGLSQVSTPQVSTPQVGTSEVGITQVSFGQISSKQISTPQVSLPQVGILDGSSFQVDIAQVSATQIGMKQGNFAQVSTSENSTPEIGVTSIVSYNKSSSQVNTSKIPLPSSISSEQLVSIHNSTPASIYTINNSAQTLWSSLLTPTSPLNINLQISDLPTGQLAEAQITKFDPQGRPNGGTITIDTDANGIGWYIDPTPHDHSEFTQPLTDTAFRATTTSPAAGKYDLLTTILHEMGHIAGIISGHNSFDRHIQTINNSPTFIGNNFTATLTPDGSHLDSKYHPHDLMNNTISPGVRKLPSQLNLQILNTIRNSTTTNTNIASLTAPLTSAPLIGILNGTFDTNENWTTRGAATIINQQAVLTEDSLLNSKFSQSFTIPQDTKYLQFTLRNITLGQNTPTTPGDAFEVALLNTLTKSSLTDTIDLTHTDAFLNIQHNGTIYQGDNLTQINPYTYRLDIRNIQPNTTATLYFDLLGFGAKDARIVIDDVKLFSNEPIPPTANNDTATTDQTLPVTINILANDTDTEGELDLASVNITATPTNGTIQINPNGTIIYTPNSNFVGTDTFTYTVLDIDGLPSNPATVTDFKIICGFRAFCWCPALALTHPTLISFCWCPALALTHPTLISFCWCPALALTHPTSY